METHRWGGKVFSQGCQQSLEHRQDQNQNSRRQVQGSLQKQRHLVGKVRWFRSEDSVSTTSVATAPAPAFSQILTPYSSSNTTVTKVTNVPILASSMVLFSYLPFLPLQNFEPTLSKTLSPGSATASLQPGIFWLWNYCHSGRWSTSYLNDLVFDLW